MGKAFCTIVTGNYLGTAYALAESIQQFDSGMVLHVLVTDGTGNAYPNANRGVKIHSLKDLKGVQLSDEIIARYSVGEPDKLRWSLKPIFITYLLSRGYEKIIFTDPDTCYFSDYSFLFEYLDRNRVLLTPHWRNHNPEVDKANFDLLYVGGIFNAGFFAANADALPVLDWWARACLDECEKSFAKGKFVDQSYLNLLPIYFEEVHVLQHRGCNVANWNQRECRRSLSADGGVLINEKWPVVFVHFTASTVAGIQQGRDRILGGYLESYVEKVTRNGGVVGGLAERKGRKKSRSGLLRSVVNTFKRLLPHHG